MNQSKIPSDGDPIGSDTLVWDLGEITIWNHLSKKNANLGNSACTVQDVILINSVILKFLQNGKFPHSRNAGFADASGHGPKFYCSK